jgi:hypothetical protein
MCVVFLVKKANVCCFHYWRKANDFVVFIIKWKLMFVFLVKRSQCLLLSLLKGSRCLCCFHYWMKAKVCCFLGKRKSMFVAFLAKKGIVYCYENWKEANEYVTLL